MKERKLGLFRQHTSTRRQELKGVNEEAGTHDAAINGAVLLFRARNHLIREDAQETNHSASGERLSAPFVADLIVGEDVTPQSRHNNATVASLLRHFARHFRVNGRHHRHFRPSFKRACAIFATFSRAPTWRCTT